MVCDETIFHPQGGGQPADNGTINGIAVMGVKKQNGTIVHFLPEAIPMGIVTMRVDRQIRYRHSRLHSAGHLIGHVLETAGRLKAIKAHHWPDEAKVTFDNPDGISVTADAVQTWFDEAVARQLPRHVAYRGDVRLIGFGTDWAYPCGGTHVAHTGELAGVRIEAVSVRKGQLSVRYHD
ncbi:hypothetical protein [Conchiformibius kuhniae]|nr:hypothetical protein [Conchiformibius kuhniae]